MLRINQIIKILSDMKPYAPYTYKSKTDKLIDKIHGKLLAIVIIFIAVLVLCIFLYESSSFAKEGANKRGNSSRLTQSFHFFMFEPIFSPVNALNQPI